MKGIWVHKATSFKKAKEFEHRYYMRQSPAERLSDIQLCRELYFKMRGIADESRKRFRRIIRVIKQT